MTRSIVLRFDATCFDCGRSLSAGTTARWFGKGRVSCCGGQPSVLPPNRNAAGRNVNGSAFGSPDVVPLPPLGVPAAPRRDSMPIPPYLPNAPLAQLARDTGIPVENLASGLSQAHVAQLATKTPNQRLLVRLSSGARLIVPALHCAHVARCIEESCIDRIRDVALLADGRD